MPHQTQPSPREVFARCQRDFLGDTPDTDLYAEDVVIEAPFAPPGQPRRIHGREEWLAFAKAGRESLQVRPERFRNVVIHETTDPEVIIVEYELVGAMPGTDEPASAPFIGVLRARDGQVVLWREYQNVLAMAEATRQLPALLAGLSDAAGGQSST